MREQLKEQIADIATTPNFITGARYFLTPLMARKLEEKPKEMWPVVAGVMATDNVDGFLARLGNKSKVAHKLGFRTSRTGRLFDPITDKRTTYMVGKACVDNGIIPRYVGRYATNQKLTASARAAVSWARGLDVPVTKHGKRSEFAINTFFGAAVAAESIENDTHRKLIRGAALIAGTVAVGAAANADQGYARMAREMAQAGEGSHESIPRIAGMVALGGAGAVISIIRRPHEAESIQAAA